jgi:chemotaxis protein methyltransferase WspC
VYLSQHRTSADAYVLLGQVHQAMGKELQAEQDFQKAIYLQPKHLDGLMHLALLLEQQGNGASAAIIRQRIQRLI